MLLRAARGSDAEALVLLHHRAVHAVAPGTYPTAILESWSPPPDPVRFDWMAERIVDPANGVLVCEIDGTITGFVFAVPATGWIRALYVDPRCARRGVGAALLDAAEALLHAAGSLRAGLNASLNAVAFYEAQGYRMIEATTQELHDGSRMDCVAMDKVLTVGPTMADRTAGRRP